jgi:hypothetical protein
VLVKSEQIDCDSVIKTEISNVDQKLDGSADDQTHRESVTNLDSYSYNTDVNVIGGDQSVVIEEFEVLLKYLNFY